MRLHNLGKSILIASIPGTVLPIIFWRLFALNTTATGKDIFPALDDPLELIGCVGSLVFASSPFIIFVTLAAIIRVIHDHGLMVPNVQSEFLMAISLAINTLLWSLPISFVFRVRKHSVSLSTAIQDNDSGDQDSNY